MNRTLVLALLLWCNLTINAQKETRVFSWAAAQKMPKDSVFAIDASKLKWDSIPAALFKYDQLQYLNLSRNKLTDLPMEIGKLKKLRVIDVSRNKLDNFPTALCQMNFLKRIALNRNQITSIPGCIGFFQELTYLDLWDNPIASLPDEFMELKSLKTVDLRGVLFGPVFQAKWQTAMPQVQWFFDPPCNCLE